MNDLTDFSLSTITMWLSEALTSVNMSPCHPWHERCLADELLWDRLCSGVEAASTLL